MFRQLNTEIQNWFQRCTPSPTNPETPILAPYSLAMYHKCTKALLKNRHIAHWPMNLMFPSIFSLARWYCSLSSSVSGPSFLSNAAQAQTKQVMLFHDNSFPPSSKYVCWQYSENHKKRCSIYGFHTYQIIAFTDLWHDPVILTTIH